MALKDWKKDTEGTTQEGVPLTVYYIDKPFSDEIIIQKMLDKYEVLIQRGLEVYQRKYFKTKKQALKYAKNYMRRN